MLFLEFFVKAKETGALAFLDIEALKTEYNPDAEASPITRALLHQLEAAELIRIKSISMLKTLLQANNIASDLLDDMHL